MPLVFNPNKINLNKTSIVFTWDDNQSRQISVIAPLFKAKGVRCTFYVVPGEEDFQNKYSAEYADLANNDFEIGSHSYTHKHMTQISSREAEFEFTHSAECIRAITNKYPISFAFPHHDYDDAIVLQAKKYYFETRNTLNNSKRFSIKTNTQLAEMIHALTDGIHNKYNIIFSGHSIITDSEYYSQKDGEGYEPIRISLVEEFFSHIASISQKVEVITFAQASLKEFIRTHKLFDGQKFCFSDTALLFLSKVGIAQEQLRILL